MLDDMAEGAGSSSGPAVTHRSVLRNSTETTCERPIPLVLYDKFRYAIADTKHIFATRGFQDMDLSVVAVTGRSTKSKSQILNYFLRYANFRYVFNQHEDEWLHDGDLPCEGWKWRGYDSMVGITMWTDFFIFETPEKKKAAILILATEGITNNNADSNEAHAIISLVALSSSVHVHTIQKKIQDDDLDDVELATMYATLITNKTLHEKTKSYQKLICVVSDWSQDDDVFGELGFAGGWEYFLKDGDHKKKMEVHDRIKDYYSDVRGFLMPSGDPDGNLKNSSLKFKENLKQLVENVLAPENVKMKTLNGKPIKVGDLLKYLELWTAVLNSPETPIVHVSYKTSTQLQTMIAREAAYRAYNRYMIDVFSSRRHISKDELELYNHRGVKAAMAAYNRVLKLENDPQSRESLQEEMKILYNAYAAKNQHRTTWYYATYDAIYRTLKDTSYSVWLVLFLVYYALEKFAPKSRFVWIMDKHFVAVKHAFVVSLMATSWGRGTRSHRNSKHSSQAWRSLMDSISGGGQNLNLPGNTSQILFQQRMRPKSLSLIDVKIKDHGEDYRVIYRLHLRDMKKLMEQSGAANMRVAVISVTGKVRSGKSFILEFFLRYAKHKYILRKPDKGWLGSRDEPLREGFSWSHGFRERDTVGVQVWPQFFICSVRGERVCIILMDTQGSHDNESTWQEMAGIFAISTLASSLQIYNVRNRIDDADLSHLEKFCAHAGMLSKSGLKPFQKILFLVRDWGMYNFHDYGFEGGYNYLKDAVFRDVKEPERLKTRHNIRTYFEEMACFLMPDPGEAAKGKQGFEGHLRDLDNRFIEQLDQFVPSVLATENLVLKKVDGEPVTVGLLLQYLNSWVDRFNTANISAMTIMANTTTEVKRLQVKNDALELYNNKMDDFCKTKLHFSEEEFLANHVLAKEAALSFFNQEAVIADEAAIRTKHKQTLLEDIEFRYVEYKTAYSHKLFRRDKVVYLPCIAIPICTLCYTIERNSWMKTGAPYWATIVLFWMSVAILGYWVMLLFTWLVTGCARKSGLAILAMGNEWSAKLAHKSPLSVIRIRDVPDSLGRTFIFNEEEVGHHLLAPNVRKLPVVVISVAGVARTGKSFFLAFLLRYAVIRFLEKSDGANWLGDDETQMGGFEFENTIAMKTNGVVMWPNLFECTTRSGEKICILLMDTQGTYDSGEGSSTIWATVFALSVLTSSLQIYNIEEEITEEDLQSLELDIGFMRLLPDQFAEKKPGQHLVFLVRDFKLKDSYSTGYDGGNNYLREKVFNNDIDEMHQQVRNHITGAFEEIDCCTLPYPGRTVVESKVFQGKLKDVDFRFKNAAAAAVEQILNVDNLVVKKIGGKPVTCERLYAHIGTLVHSFNTLEIPTVVSPLRALADSDHDDAVEAAVKVYMAKMEAAGCTAGFVDAHELDLIHEDSFDAALKLFHGRPKLGQGEVITPFHVTKLHNAIIKKYDEYATQNSARLTSVMGELPVWSILLLCCLSISEELKPTTTTYWLKLVVMARLLFWVLIFYWRWVFAR